MLGTRPLARRIVWAAVLAGAVPTLVAGIAILYGTGRFHGFATSHPGVALTLALTLVASGIAGAIWSVRLGMHISRGLTDLREQAMAMARGDLARRVEDNSRQPGGGCRDEIDQVALSLNLLSAHLSQGITERDRYESDLRTLNAELEGRIDERTRELEEAQRLLVQGEKRLALQHLVAGIAHEINNHVNFITSAISPVEMGHSDLKSSLEAWRRVGDSGADERESALANAQSHEREIELDLVDEEVRLSIEQMKEGAQRILNIVGNLQTFSHAGNATPMPADLGELIERSLNLIRPRLGTQVALEKRVDLMGPTLCHPHQISQVLANLLLNAAGAVGDEGRIVVEAERSGADAVITVRDTGCGIPPENLTKIFDPFFTTKEVGQGTGLGLFVCQQIMEEHHGSIHVESVPGQGTEVVLRWPLDLQGRSAAAGSRLRTVSVATPA